ncbi:putative P450 monooxygenase [Microthyrium microscopicum]|uniref:Putative P450 monooxygenase n=1 Tax=Microthyrium microscopicum TaxID=703497 RepID=A0A6A6UIT8_9PEZI|nr:putative P450 monooxygenase [Microthyrium microscopicum]
MKKLQTLAATVVFSAAAEAMAAMISIPQYLPTKSFATTFLGAIFLTITVWSFYQMFIYPSFVSPLRHLPHPKGGNLFLGHGLSLFKRPPGNDFLKWMNEIPNDGVLMFNGFGNQPRIVLTNPRALSEVLVTKTYDFKKPKPLRTFLRRILGDGLIIVEGEEHKFQRKHVMPVFSFRHIKELYPMIWKKAVALTQGIEAEMAEKMDLSMGEKSKHNVVEVNHWANKVTMDIIGVAGLGREFNALKNSDDPLVHNYEEILEPTTEKLTFFAMQIILPQFIVNRLPWKINERVRVITSNLNRICGELVADKRALIKADADEHLDILSVLIKSNNFSDKQLVDQLLTFLAAGHETTSSAFTWVTYLLSTHPEIQTRLREEIRKHIPTNPGPDFDLATVLEAMPLLNGVCNETLRLYPTVPITIRDCYTDTTVCDHYIPRGTQVHLVPWATNRLPEFWGSNAGDFVPDRWIDKETGRPNNTGGSSSNYNILTFLHGPRSCIGEKFAKAELRCLVAAMVGAYEMEYADPSVEAIPHGVITTKPRWGMELRLKSLQQW